MPGLAKSLCLPRSALRQPPGVAPDGHEPEAPCSQLKGIGSVGARHSDCDSVRQAGRANSLDPVRVRAWYRLHSGRQAHGDPEVGGANVDAVDTGYGRNLLNVFDPKHSLDHDDAGGTLTHRYWV